MAWFSSLVLVAQLLSFIYASPIVTSPLRSQLRTVSERSSLKWKLDDLSDEFKGIFWDRAFTGCTSEQLDKLVYSTRAAMWMLDAPIEDGNFHLSDAWNRYFFDYMSWVKHGDAYRNAAADIISNIRQVAKYSRRGHKKGPTKGRRVHYICNVAKIRGVGSPCRNAQAVTANPDDYLEGNAWAILFCPRFFESTKLDYLERIRDGERKSRALIGTLDPYERTVIHEFMHVDMFGYKKPHISDIRATVRPYDAPTEAVDVYGEVRCRDFAKKFINKPNIATRENADTYSWFFTYYYFNKVWGWGKDGQPAGRHDELKKGVGGASEERELTEDDLKIDIPTPSFPKDEKDTSQAAEFPANCHISTEKDTAGIPRILCDYIGMDYDEWVAELDKSFQSAGGCELSPKCHKSLDGVVTDPECICKCNGQKTDLNDKRCEGFNGVVPPRTTQPDLHLA